MKNEERLYDVLGELLYAVAKADGVIQSEEKDALKKLFENHPSGTEIIWSFEYEESKETSIDELYNKVINFCHGYGPSPIYVEFIEGMKVIAESSDGVDANESKIINSFSKDLLERFQKESDRIMNNN
ncbi:TerB family tellurite resistance protein [Saccharicrinis aurantiacus]|uniref:tellurite resistance TerB family protein n=1 Tax=Saccharicrinis aurantiacus TaxID=1849719 RepID=UPI0024935EB3|nr:TerB family tellurite resistance protein [Saccharicrinis aurantiacus]